MSGDRDAAAPHSLDEKLQRYQSNGQERARAALSGLRRMDGYREEETETVGRGRTAKTIPVLVSVRPMDTRRWWRRLDGDATADAWFELVESRPEYPPQPNGERCPKD